MDPKTDWVYTPKIARTSIDFSGSPQRIEIGNKVVPGFANGITLAGWMGIAVIGELSYVVCFQATWENMYNTASLYRSQNYVRADLDGGTYSSGAVLYGNGRSDPYHLAVTCTNGSQILYVNGQAVSTFSDSMNFTDVARDCSVGTWMLSDLWGNCTDRLSDVMAWTRVLAPSEIRQLANPANYMLSGLIRPIGSEFNVYDREGIR
jgi:hypothetical protein